MEYNNYEKFKNQPKIVKNMAHQAYTYIQEGEKLFNKASTNENLMFVIKDMRNKLNNLIESGRIEENDDTFMVMQDKIKNVNALLTKPFRERSVNELLYSYSEFDDFNNLYRVCGGKDV
ncbi:hypothetical protein ACJDT4_12425 [Clostridium neuense]|uniref:Uncharacterized protein n=1 Tax=Clostridium neuense TaxID=1728934 RepID=A0ABW8TFN4_9CLOT